MVKSFITQISFSKQKNCTKKILNVFFNQNFISHMAQVTDTYKDRVKSLALKFHLQERQKESYYAFQCVGKP